MTPTRTSSVSESSYHAKSNLRIERESWLLDFEFCGLNYLVSYARLTAEAFRLENFVPLWRGLEHGTTSAQTAIVDNSIRNSPENTGDDYATLPSIDSCSDDKSSQ